MVKFCTFLVKFLNTLPVFALSLINCTHVLPRIGPEKTPKKSEPPLINTRVSIIKQHWKKMVEAPLECNFRIWSTQKFVRKVKQFVRKYYIS